MLQLLTILGFALTLTTGTAMAASPPQETPPCQDTLQQRIVMWQQRVDAESSSNPALVTAWQDVEQHWRLLQNATPVQRHPHLDNLKAALQALESAWQNPPPYFYAIDLVTRRHA